MKSGAENTAPHPKEASMKRLIFVLFALVTLSIRAAEMENIPIEEDASDAKLNKIVIIAGSPNPANVAHQYYAGAVIMYKLLKQTPGVFPVLVKDDWPKNEKIFENAKAIVLYFDNDTKKNALVNAARVDVLQKAIEQGAGLVNFHKAFELPPESGERIQKWLGAYYNSKNSNKGHWDATLDPIPKSPVTRGMTPFKLNDGWCVGLTWLPDTKGITPLFRAPKAPKPGQPAEPVADEKEWKDVFAWTYERADGGRAYGMTGVHSHKYFEIESFRKLVINGILWAAKLEVPENGAPVSMEGIDFERNVFGKATAK